MKVCEVAIDNNLSLKAKGLFFLLYVFSRNNIEINKEKAMLASPDGKKSFDSAWNELKETGHLKQCKKNSANGFSYTYELM